MSFYYMIDFSEAFGCVVRTWINGKLPKQEKKQHVMKGGMGTTTKGQLLPTVDPKKM